MVPEYGKQHVDVAEEGLQEGIEAALQHITDKPVEVMRYLASNQEHTEATLVEYGEYDFVGKAAVE